MRQVVSILRHMLQPQNAGTWVYFILNLLLIVGMFAPAGEEALAGLLVVYLVSLLLSLSPLGEAVLCLFNGTHRMRRLDMRARVLPLVAEVYAKAKAQSPDLPDRINVRYRRDPSPNAYAIGFHTICVTDGLMDLSDDMICGILAHEMGHLAMHHTSMQLIIGGGNWIMTGMVAVMNLVCALFTGSTALGMLDSRRDEDSSFAGSVLFLFALFFAGLVWCWTKLCTLLLMWSSRSNEFAADEYAWRIGYGEALAEALDNLTLRVPEGAFLSRLTDSHPETDERIGRLQALGVRYSRY